MADSAVDVCVITTIHANYDARIYDRGVRVLTEAGLRVSFVGPWPFDERSGVAPDQWRTIRQFRHRGMRLFGGFAALRAALQIRARVYHFHDLDFLPWALILNAVTPAKVVYDVHENYPEDIRDHKEYLPRLLRRPIAALVTALEHTAARHFAATVVVVPHLENRFSRVARRTVLIRNFSRYEAQPELPHAPNILYSGGISISYGAFTLLQIGRELQKRQVVTRLVLVDKFVDGALRKTFLAAVARESLPVDVMPLVPPSELHRIMALGVIGLVTDEPSPSIHLGVHAKFFDYMAMGLPIVASDLPNARKLLTAAGCGVMVPPSDASAFVDAALDLLANPRELERLRENGLSAFRRSYSWRGEADKLVGLIRDLSGSRGS